MNSDFVPIMLLGIFLFLLGGGTGMVLLIQRARRTRAAFPNDSTLFDFSPEPTGSRSGFLPRPAAWLAIRSRNLKAVQSALSLHNPQPCRWVEGIANEQKLFIAPPVNGWILVFGSGLPDPADDVDACFRFLTDLSRKLGQVQFFQADHVLNHHAWVRVESARIVRGYAWADKTLWHQGARTAAEADLGLKCFQYLETPERTFLAQPDFISMNTEKVPQLAARWSLDPASIDERILEHALGIAGEL